MKAIPKAISIFLCCILTANVADVEVSVVVAGVGDIALFSCGLFGAVNIEWLINATSLAILQLSGVMQGFDSVGGTGSLQLLNVPAEYNGTRVQCIVYATSGIVQVRNSTLLLQGSLSGVGDLRVSSIDDSIVLLNWTAPFTLDITLTLVDITYCVDVVSSSSSATLHSECGITETEFTYPLPSRSWCHEYNFTVTPVNVVGNGTKRSISYKAQDLLIPNRIKGLTRLDIIYTIVMSSPICTASLWCMDMDDDAEEPINIGNGNLSITEANITFTSQPLRPNRHYAYNITAANILGNGIATSQNDNLLSTHDITECSTNFNSNGVEVFVRFIENSNASGALISFIFMEDEEIDFSKSFVRAVDEDDLSHGHMIPIHNFSPGNYEAFCYDIEDDGRILNGVAYQASSTKFEVMSDQVELIEPTALPASSNCSVSSLSGVINVSCSYSFQVTVQLGDDDVVSNLKVNTSIDSDPATIQVEENGMYLVTILRIGDSGITSELPFSHMEMVTDIPTSQGPTASATETPGTPPSPLAITAVTGSVIILALVVAVVVTLFVLKSKRKVARPTMFIAGEGVDQDIEHEQATEHDINHNTATTATPSLISFAIQEENSKPDDYCGHVYSRINKAKKTHTPTSTTVVAPMKSSPSIERDSYLFVAGGTDGTPPWQTSAELTVTEDGHYSTLDHGTARPAEMNPSCEDSTYSLPMKYQNPDGQQYSLLQLKNSNTTDESLKVSRSVHQVQYTEVQPAQNLLKGCQPPDTPVHSQQDGTQMQDETGSDDPYRYHCNEENVPLIDDCDGRFDASRYFVM